MDSTRHQEILDRCWNALPEGCPMRQWDREQFDDVWGYWEPSALARVDPTCSMKISLFFVEVFAQTPDENLYQAHKHWIDKHCRWLQTWGSRKDLDDWSEGAQKCRNNAEEPLKQLIKFIEIAEAHPIFKGELGEDIDVWAKETQKQIKEQCRAEAPKLFVYRVDRDSWRSIVNNAKLHLGKIPADKPGRPKKN